MSRRLQSVTFILLLLGSRTGAQSPEDLQRLPALDPPLGGEAVPADVELIGEPPEIASDYPGWTQPFLWFPGRLWTGSWELGLNGIDGNSQSLSLRAGADLKRETPSNALQLTLTYSKTEANSIETQNNALLNGRWDWNLPQPNWFLFNRLTLEYDEFKAFDLRLTLACGAGYHWIKNERTTLTSRLGAGVSHEFNGPDDSWVPEANFGADFSHQLTARQKINAVFDYYPAWDEFSDYRILSKLDWEVLLDQETNLSLKIGALEQYDSTPNGLRPNDLNYYVTLLWKL